jgi:DNA polymerase-3 subunit alpha
MATNLSSIADKKDKLALYINDCRRSGIEMLPPDINESEADFTVRRAEGRPTGIRIGLAVIKNVSRAAVEEVCRVRSESGRFVDFQGFVNRVCGGPSWQVATRTAVECLVKAGCFDQLPGHRAQLLAGLDDLLQAAASLRRERERGQESLFGEAHAEARRVELPPVAEMSGRECLALERELLGVYVSDHPVREAAPALRDLRVTPISELSDLGDRKEVTVGGIIAAVTTRTTRTSQTMAQVILEDTSGSVTAMVFPKWYEQCRACLAKDLLVVIRGRTNVRERAGDDDDAPPVVEIQAEEVRPLLTGPAERVPTVHVRLRLARRNELLLLRSIFAANPGDARLYFHVERGGEEEHVLAGMRVRAHPRLLEEVRAVLGRGDGSVWVE